ncbi:EamA-like transporter family protein [Tenacibaculum sp. Bg11-29]|uniref:DMT family transporter n=1 Tax=Tenacibaculum sp. Bg11-29 TaxID=2058306 RepID=UPI000C3430E8|nr:DMT family transporter [Tenacibaculum sp. Bg11-29]PKH53010.1 EamA-like transporter family protein [Tenacibaculum sp. Bg11-29]
MTSKYNLLILAFIGGVFLAMQGGLNTRLGILLKNPVLASLVAFFSSTVFALIFVLFNFKAIPTILQIREIPFYLWFTGGFFSVLGISLYYYTIPKLGISTMISIGLFGQLIFAVIAGNYGWLNLPLEPITLKKIIGISSMIIGVLLINIK